MRLACKLNLFHFESAVDFLQALFNAYTQENHSLSMRSFAKKLDISPSTLSEYLCRKSKISAENAAKISRYLQFSSLEADYFLTKVIQETTSQEELKLKLNNKIQYLSKQHSAMPNAKIEKLLDTTEVSRHFEYYDPKSYISYLLLQLKHKSSKKNIPDFYEIIIHAYEEVNFSRYYIQNSDNSFTCYIKNNIVDFDVAENNELKPSVSFDSNSMPKITNVLGPKHKNMKEIIPIDMHYSLKSLNIKGRSCSYNVSIDIQS